MATVTYNDKADLCKSMEVLLPGNRSLHLPNGQPMYIPDEVARHVPGDIPYVTVTMDNGSTVGQNVAAVIKTLPDFSGLSDAEEGKKIAIESAKARGRKGGIDPSTVTPDFGGDPIETPTGL